MVYWLRQMTSKKILAYSTWVYENSDTMYSLKTHLFYESRYRGTLDRFPDLIDA